MSHDSSPPTCTKPQELNQKNEHHTIPDHLNLSSEGPLIFSLCVDTLNMNQPCLQQNLVHLHLLVLLPLLFFLFRQFLQFYLPLPVLDDRANEIMSDGITFRELRFKSFIKQKILKFHFRWLKNSVIEIVYEASITMIVNHLD